MITSSNKWHSWLSCVGYWWVTGISAYIAYKHRVHTTDNEAGCYHVIVAQDYGYVISL